MTLGILCKPIYPRTLAFAAFIPALLFCILFYNNLFMLYPFGWNVLVGIAAFYALLSVVLGKSFLKSLGRTPVHFICVILLSVTFALFNNPILLFINACLIILLTGEQVMLGAGKALYTPYSVAFIGDSLFCWFCFSFSGIGGAVHQFRKANGRFAGILIGIVITIPILLIVALLLLSGDVAFAKLFTEFFGSLNIEDVIGRLLFILFLFFFFAGLFWSLLNKKRGIRTLAAPAAPAVQKKIPQPASLVLLISLAAFLLLFCFVQFIYLFSGKVPEGLSYSEYARSGFWQLLAAAGIVIFTLFLLFRREMIQGQHPMLLQKILATLLLICTSILLVSSFTRMVLYEQAFGFSQLRLFTQFFMVGLFISLGCSIARLWFFRIPLKKCIFLCFMICYLALAYWNVDAFIARENIKNQGMKADISYLTTLSADALPYYIDFLHADDFEIQIVSDPDIDSLTGDYQYLDNGQIALYKDSEIIRQAWHLRRTLHGIELSDNDWRYWNAGRIAAQNSFSGCTDLIEKINAIKQVMTSHTGSLSQL